METTNNQGGTPPDNNLVWAIICTVACCLPLGIVAIIKSTKVKELWAAGDHAGAEKAAADAKKYSIWGMALAGVGLIIYFILIAIGVAAGGF